MIALLLALFLIGAGRRCPTSAGQPAGSPSMAQFVAALQQAVSRNDKSAVASMVRYPLDVRAGTLQIPVSDANAFVKLYESMITPGMKSVIARARVPADGQKSVTATTGSGGAMTFEGALTIAPAGGGFKITQMTVPLSPQSSSPGAAVARQLTFRVGTPNASERHAQPGRHRPLRVPRSAGRVRGRSALGHSRAGRCSCASSTARRASRSMRARMREPGSGPGGSPPHRSTQSKWSGSPIAAPSS